LVYQQGLDTERRLEFGYSFLLNTITPFLMLKKILFGSLAFAGLTLTSCEDPNCLDNFGDLAIQFLNENEAKNAEVNQPVTLRFQVENVELAGGPNCPDGSPKKTNTVGASDVRIQLIECKSGGCNGAVLVDDLIPTPSLAPGTAEEIRYTVTFPARSSYRMVVTADYNKIVTERNEYNNQLTMNGLGAR
jgi:hypothetical protein